MDAPIRILLTKPTHDCHDRGVRYLMRVLRDAGFEVVFTNFLVSDDVLSAALQEDVDVIGISSSAGGHMPVFEELMDGLREREMTDVLVIGGGIIADSDAVRLREMGVGEIFGPGGSPADIEAFIRQHVRRQPGVAVR
ncbi:cobalamin-dependent protein [Microtetraspora sp. NBRC 16547]|uniref:cobalamin-dependent protein n=1 Tax=Microtetraspora sp. NBRC 16547 TaxID=3030993 RepID=UPI0024A39AFA|nr:cobalamin-dependent protein [Microtetraspora sp. NBRC 16547]GLW99310.1 methylmalonyl-CoA mutase [Microtetraspora sp. NBRC 16547]